jgi:hypothetical protein
MRLNCTIAAALALFTALAASSAASASDFNERLAAWNVGPQQGRVQQSAHQEAIQPSAPQADGTRSVPPTYAPATPPAARAAPYSPWHDMAYGHGRLTMDPGLAMSPGSCGPGGCGTCGDCGPHDCEMCCGKPLWWCKLDVLLWWREGRDLPPLVTTDDPTIEDSTTAGILPDATILFGGGREVSQMQVGGRVDLGFWLDPQECMGLGNRFFGLGRDSMRFRIDSLDNPVLAIPFNDAGTPESLLVAFPGISSGSIDVQGTSEVLGNDLYLRCLICRDCDSRLDFVTGWHFSRINDDLRIRSRSTITETGGDIPFGTQSDVLDRFDTRNEFHGAILGLVHEYECRCWSWTTLARMSLGNMNQQVIIDGQTTIAVPDEDPEITAGGLFTNPDTNIGTASRDEFTAVTEVGLTLAYHWGDCTKLSVGYSFIYWSDVLRPGDHIDPNIGDGQPAFRFNRGDYWVQGVNLGLVREF